MVWIMDDMALQLHNPLTLIYHVFLLIGPGLVEKISLLGGFENFFFSKR